MTIAVLILRVLLGLLFAGVGLLKLFGTELEVKTFDAIGLGQWFRYAAGLIEVAAALLLIRVRTVTLGAGLMVCVCIGAFVAQWQVLHGDVIHCIVLGMAAAFLAWRYRAALTVR